jgi:hypothetical protein
MSSWLGPMRMVCAASVLLCLAGCEGRPPPAPVAQAELPYSACEPMNGLRSNLTGSPYPSAKSDALLHELGVRCIGEVYLPGARARY